MVNGQELIYANGAANRTVIRGGAQKLLHAAAEAHDTIVSGGSQQIAAAGAKAYDTIVSGGTQLLNVAGVEAHRTRVEGGIIDITAGKTVSTTIAGKTVSTTIAGTGREMVRNGATASFTVIEEGDGAHNQFVRAGGIASNTVIRGGSQQLYDANAKAFDAVISGGRQDVYAGAIAERTIISGGTQNVMSGGIVSNTTIVAAGDARLALAAGAITQGTVTWDLSQGSQSTNAMLNAWRISAGTDLRITVAATDQTPGKYFLSSGMGFYNDETFTVKAGDTELTTGLKAGDSYKDAATGFTYSLDIVANGLYFTVQGYPVEIYRGGDIFDYGTTVADADIIPGMSAYIYSGGTLQDATITRAGAGKVMVYSGGTIVGAAAAGQGTSTDITVWGGGVASDTLLKDNRAFMRLSGGRGVNTTVSGGQLLMYAGAVASGAALYDSASQKLLAPGAVAYDTVIYSGASMQVGATLKQTSGSYIAGGAAYGIDAYEEGTVYVEGGATASGVRIHESGFARFYKGAEVAVESVASGAEVAVRFSEADGNDAAIVTDWGTIAEGAKLVFGEFGGAGTYKVADTATGAFSTVDFGENLVLATRIANADGKFSDAF
ncbi:MAG: hypothetical protein IJJ28_06225, partial [Lentisphaeria bacterium]|nr:hypothetical protein [Lentisphaeria bacterium]